MRKSILLFMMSFLLVFTMCFSNNSIKNHLNILLIEKEITVPAYVQMQTEWISGHVTIAGGLVIRCSFPDKDKMIGRIQTTRARAHITRPIKPSKLNPNNPIAVENHFTHFIDIDGYGRAYFQYNEQTDNFSQKEFPDNKQTLNQEYAIQEREREQLAEQNRRKLADMQQRQFRAQQQIHRSIETTANNLNRAFEASMAAHLEKELRRRETVANNFINSNIEKVNKVQNLYNRIPVNQFNKVLNGQFKGHVFLNRKYSFLNGEELYTEIPAIINVENDIVKNIYLYEKEGFELKYPMEQPQKSKLNNGLVEYVDMAAYETITVVLVEPYLFDNPENPEVDKDEYGYLSIYAKKKRDDGKTVWIQEIDVKKNQVNREFTVKLKYLKNKKELESEDFEKYPVNTKYSIYYFGEPVQRPFGRIPLFLKVSKKNQKPLKNNEHRIVEIKNYRDR